MRRPRLADYPRCSTVSIFDGNRSFCVIATPTCHEAYVDELVAAGVRCSRFASDHKHHHGLMYALSIEGVTSGRASATGRERQKSLGEMKAAGRKGIDARASCRSLIGWASSASRFWSSDGDRRARTATSAPR